MTAPSHGILAVGRNCPDVDFLLGPDGPIAKGMPGWQYRPGQVTIAQVVRRAWRQRDHAITEGGTGSGKTYSLLVPAILHALETGRPVVFSTKTTTLQRQVQDHDLPTLQRLLGPWLTDKFGRSFTFATRFGIGRYLCQAKDLSAYPDLEDWAEETEDGDLGRLPYALPPGAHRAVTADHNSCPGTRCRMADTCFYLAAKRASRSADIVVVSHALLMASLLAQPGTVLPLADAYVIDEAHELEREARECRGTQITPRRVSLLVARVLEFCGEHRQGALWPADPPPAALPEVEPEVSAGALLEEDQCPLECPWCEQPCDPRCDCDCHRGTGRFASDTVARHLPTQEAVDSEMAAFLDTLAEGLRKDMQDGAALLPPLQGTTAAVYLEEVQGQLRRLRQEVLVTQEQFSDVDEGFALAQSLAGSLVDLSAELRDLTSPREGRVAWIQGQTLHAQPLEVAQFLGDSQLLKAPVALSSATLATGVGQDAFAYVQEALGLRTLHQVQAPSPFDWPKQAWLYLPEEGLHGSLLGFNVPKSKREEYQHTYCRVSALHINEVLRYTKGRAFLLFTSARALELTRDYMGAIPWPYITQGEMGQAETLSWFRNTPNAVLFGLATYFEGVDVVGDSLSCVVIDKIPINPPSDLLHQARLQRAGGGPRAFREISVPLAVTRLRQGFGRLIRSVWDRGLAVLLDPRLRGKHSYILEALPPARRIERRDLRHVPFFLAASGEPCEGPSEVLHGLLAADTTGWTAEHKAYHKRLCEMLPVLPPGLWRVGLWLLDTYKGGTS